MPRGVYPHRARTQEEFAAHFWSKVDKSAGPDGCWPWTAALANGYGRVKRDGRVHGSHRLAWELVNGPIPEGMDVLHRCDNPPCCNVGRCLRLGTHAENMADKVAKGRCNAARGEQSGSRRHPESRPRGEKHALARVTEADVRDIRRRFASGETSTAIARSLGVSQPTVGNILRGKTWAHVTEPSP